MKISEFVIQYAQKHPLIGIMGDNVNNGVYLIPFRNYEIKVIASNGGGWDHVSVSLNGPKRCPNWEEMCLIKDLFFDESETVVQFHPKKSEYINNHSRCLHLWRRHNVEHELPSSIMIGIKSEDSRRTEKW